MIKWFYIFRTNDNFIMLCIRSDDPNIDDPNIITIEHCNTITIYGKDS